MKQIISISSVFIGLVIGAGFASGREIFEYFSIPSSTDLTGIAIATISFGAICYITMHLAQKTKCRDFDTLISHLSGRFSPAVKLFMFSYMFCGFFVMMSACGALTSQILNISPRYGIWLLALVCFFVFSFDLKGLVTFNAILVPLMASGMLFVCLSSAFSALPAFSALTFLKKNPLLSALCYVSYNTITAGAVLVPLSTTATKKQLAASSALSGALLGTLIFVAWSCMNLYSDRLFFMEIPLLDHAQDSGQIATIIYTL
ncbi:MAG: hypothetical protein J6Q10_03200, partial [Clostridia bacterium]|nr:hypothetical protein [Clostridia bacterium]